MPYNYPGLLRSEDTNDHDWRIVCDVLDAAIAHWKKRSETESDLFGSAYGHHYVGALTEVQIALLGGESDNVDEKAIEAMIKAAKV
jgi:hypothetical protein